MACEYSRKILNSRVATKNFNKNIIQSIYFPGEIRSRLTTNGVGDRSDLDQAEADRTSKALLRDAALLETVV